MRIGGSFVLVGTDGSPQAGRAVEWAAARARAAAPAVGVQSALVVDGPVSALLAAAAEAGLLVVGSRRLDPVTGLIVGSVGVECVTEPATPATALLTHAAGTDLLVLGADGWGGLAGILHHSVGRRACWRAPCPVAIVRAAAEPDRAPTSRRQS
ncbi:universal stress protein [Cryptosporangium sp. NPDC051539]|uniref:universal stress protein n=1 Tax=Cryptosporangium sp. NPDC051539 TaxID=3363962 RepID=UPI003797AC20